MPHVGIRFGHLPKEEEADEPEKNPVDKGRNRKRHEHQRKTAEAGEHGQFPVAAQKKIGAGQGSVKGCCAKSHNYPCGA